MSLPSQSSGNILCDANCIANTSNLQNCSLNRQIIGSPTCVSRHPHIQIQSFIKRAISILSQQTELICMQMFVHTTSQKHLEVIYQEEFLTQSFEQFSYSQSNRHRTAFKESEVCLELPSAMPPDIFAITKHWCYDSSVEPVDEFRLKSPHPSDGLLNLQEPYLCLLYFFVQVLLPVQLTL